jgi:hypothetical protein
VVDEAQPRGNLRVTSDGERALVVEAMVTRTQAAQVRRERLAAVFPVADVVDVHPAAL